MPPGKRCRTDLDAGRFTPHTGPESLLSEGVAPALERESKMLKGSAGRPVHRGRIFLQEGEQNLG